MAGSKNSFDLFKKLSKNARDSLKFSPKIGDRMLKNDLVLPEYIFLSILINRESLGSKILMAMGVDLVAVTASFLGDVPIEFKPPKRKVSNIRLSKESRDVIRAAYSYASKYSLVYVGTEHLIMGILKLKDYQFTKDLAEQGLTEEKFQESLVNYAVYPMGILVKPTGEIGEDRSADPKQLAVLGEDLVELARVGKLDPLVGREQELEQIINVLSRRRKNNPIIVGEPGVGKTALVEGLAQMIAMGTVPNSLRDKKVISLDLAAIFAGSKLRGDIEEKIIMIIKEVTEAPNVILFIDEIHNILGGGGQGGGMDIASLLKPALVRDNFRVIGATTTAEYTRNFESDNALVRRFQPINVEEPSIAETVQILKRVEPILEKHHDVNISEDALEAAVRLSDRYVSDRYLPDKAIDLLDEAAASKRLELEIQYDELASVMRDYRSIVSQKEDAVIEGDMERAVKFKEREEELKERLHTLEKSRSKIKNTVKYKVDVDIVQRVISKWTGIPITTINSQEATMLSELNKSLGEKIIGQNEAVESVASAIKRARTGIADADRPWASFLFLGPTGVGKTELAKQLTKRIFGDEKRLIQIDMSEMMEMHSVSKLIGSPPGYIGYREGGLLTEQVRKYPHSVILFDEIEKAHQDVLNILLQIMEYGHLTDGKGQKVNFKNTVVILTSNIGAEEIQKDRILGFSMSESDPTETERETAYTSMRDELMRELKNTLRPELLNRLDDIVIFRSLTRGDALEIVKVLIEDLNERLAVQNIRVQLNSKAIEQITEEGFSAEYGARPLRRTLQDRIESLIADYILHRRSSSRSKKPRVMEKLEVTFNKGEFKIK